MFPLYIYCVGGLSDKGDEIEISEIKCASGICPNPKPKPKLDIFVNFSDFTDYFVAYSVEEDGTFTPIYTIYIPIFLSKFYDFTGASSNGLFHFYDEKSKHQVLWDPITGAHRVLPKPFEELDGPITLEFSGMWYDHRFEDYKLMNLVSSRDENIPYPHKSYHIDLYSLKLNSWKKIPCADFYGIHGLGGTCACVAGVFYCRARLKQTSTRVVLSFDFSTETLSSLTPPLPSPFPSPLPPHDSVCHQYIFLEYKGLLSVLACWYEEIEHYDYPVKYELWIMMSDGSWTRESAFQTSGVERLVWLSQDGMLLYFESENDELVMFDRASGELKHLGIDWYSSHPTRKPMMIPFQR